MDGTYAPQSPDLSSFFSSPPKTQQPYTSQSTSSYAPRSPTIPSFNTGPTLQAPTSTFNQSAFSQNPPVHQHQSHHHNAFFGAAPSSQHNSGGGAGLGIPDDLNSYASNPYQIPDLPPQHTFPQHQQHQLIGSSIPTFYEPETHFKSEDSAYTSADAADASYISSPIKMGSRQPRNSLKAEKYHSHDAPPTYKDPNPTNIEIKTKFPVARIKRIMQADEEVGKVAQVTPVAVSKALELFMIALVTGAAEKAKEKGGKRVTAQHLKAVVLGAPEQFDFLAEIVGRVAEIPEGAGGEGKVKRGKKEESETSDEDAQQAAKKKGKGKGGRRKKVES